MSVAVQRSDGVHMIVSGSLVKSIEQIEGAAMITVLCPILQTPVRRYLKCTADALLLGLERDTQPPTETA